jgi:hypothetical protein
VTSLALLLGGLVSAITQQVHTPPWDSGTDLESGYLAAAAVALTPGSDHHAPPLSGGIPLAEEDSEEDHDVFDGGRGTLELSDLSAELAPNREWRLRARRAAGDLFRPPRG